MRSGSPGFVGARLKEAREARGLTAISLAELVGVTRQAMSQYENGDATPHPKIFQRITETLNLPSEFFLRPVKGAEEGTIFYRSMSAATKASRNRGERRLGWTQEIASYLRTLIDFPPVNFPQPDVPQEPTAITDRHIEEAASESRRFWGLGDGPISNVVWLLENNGAVIVRDALGAETLDAFSVWSSLDGRPYIVLSSDKESAVRSRYDCAHELGHLVLHRQVDGSRLRHSSEFRLLEDQAHRFAGAFLLPASTFADDFYVPTLDSIRVLKSKWMVSIGAMIKRARHLNLMTDEQERRLWINYNRRGWRTKEPLDDDLAIEEPRLLSRAIELVVDHALQTPTAIASSLPYHTRDIEELTGLLLGYLSDEPPPLRIIDFERYRRSSSQDQAAGPGSIIRFHNLPR
jgi:Zn-dependent peptidase ImmA (M78 family)/transcriptional regulator with XRE-family HTH domain